MDIWLIRIGAVATVLQTIIVVLGYFDIAPFGLGAPWVWRFLFVSVTLFTWVTFYWILILILQRQKKSKREIVVKDEEIARPNKLLKETTEYPQIAVPTRRVPSPAVRNAIHSDLKPFFTRGYELLELYNSSKYRDEEPWQEWVQEVNTFFRNSLDESYIDRWNSHDRLTVSSEITPFSLLPVEVPGRNRKLYADVAFRLQRLAEFDKELKN